MIDAAEIDRPSPEFLTFAEAARRSGLKIQTLYNWKCRRKLTGETGLVALAGNPRIDWTLFVRSFLEVPK